MGAAADLTSGGLGAVFIEDEAQKFKKCKNDAAASGQGRENFPSPSLEKDFYFINLHSPAMLIQEGQT